MADDIKKIIENIGETKDNLGKAKNKVSGWLDEIGYQEEVTDLQGKIWKALINVQSMPTSIAASGVSMSQTMLDQSNHLLNNIFSGEIDQSLNTAGTALTTLSGVSFSAITYSPYQVNPLPAFVELNKVMTQRNQQSVIASKLAMIDVSLKHEYENAWAGLHSTIYDKTRSPMLLIREVVRRLYDHFAPDIKVLGMFPTIKLKRDIQRQYKIQYIASIIDPWKRQTFLNEEKAFSSIYGELSKAHKDGQLNIDETRGILYQADGLIRLLLDSLT